MLTRTELMFLTIQEKAHYIWHKGMYCNSSWEGNYKINTYWMGEYYAQIWHDDQSNQIRHVVLEEVFQHMKFF